MNRLHPLPLALILTLLFTTACATQQVTQQQQEEAFRLPSTEQRRFEYLYLEATRQRAIGNADAAFDTYLQAAAINPHDAAVNYQLGSYYLQLNQPQLALDKLQRAVAGDPENEEYSMLLVSLYQKTGKGEEAIALLQGMTERNPNDPQIHFMLADLHASLGQLPEAIAAINKGEALVGMNEAISTEKYKIYKAMGQDSLAYDQMERLIAAFPSQTKPAVTLAVLYMDNGELELSRKVIEQLLEVAPNDPYVLLTQVDYLTRAGEQEELKVLVGNIVQNPDLEGELKMGIFLSFIQNHLQRGRAADELYPLFNTLLTANPTNEEAYNLYADFLLSQGKYAEAEEPAREAVRLNPTKMEYRMRLMGLALQLKAYERAVTYAAEARQAMPQEIDPYLYESLAQMQLKQYDKAVSLLRQVIALSGGKDAKELSSLYSQLGDTYHEWGKHDDAYRAYDQALKLHPDNAAVLNNYSYFLSLNGGDLKKAERMSGKAVELEPNNATYIDTYGWIFYQQGNYTLAKIYLHNALLKGGDKSPDILEHYGDVLYQTDAPQEALEYWQKSLDLGNDTPQLRKKMEQVTPTNN